MDRSPYAGNLLRESAPWCKCSVCVSQLIRNHENQTMTTQAVKYGAIATCSTPPYSTQSSCTILWGHRGHHRCGAVRESSSLFEDFRLLTAKRHNSDVHLFYHCHSSKDTKLISEFSPKRTRCIFEAKNSKRCDYSHTVGLHYHTVR